MKMIISLVKKDFCLIGYYILFSIAMTFLIPLFVMARIPEMLGLATFVMALVYALYMPLTSVSMADIKYPKVAATICSTPYSRKSIVIARYLFFVLMFIIALFCYSTLGILIPKIALLKFREILISLAIVSVVLGIYLPLQYKFGFEKTEYMIMVLVMITPLLLPLIVKFFTEHHFDFSFISSISEPVMCFILAIISTCILLVSLWFSSNIYMRKEL